MKCDVLDVISTGFDVTLLPASSSCCELMCHEPRCELIRPLVGTGHWSEAADSQLECCSDSSRLYWDNGKENGNY